MILEIIIGILSLIIVVFIYTTINLMRKVEKIEDVVIRYDRFISEYSKQIENTESKLKEIPY